MEAARMVQILRRSRHDFGNHLQVLSGYTELGQSDKVKAYIDALVRKMSGERIIFDSLPPEAALYFYEQVFLGEDLGVILVYKDLKINNWQLLQSHHEPIKSLKPLAAEISKEDEPIVYVSMQEDDKGINLSLECRYFNPNVISFKISKEKANVY